MNQVILIGRIASDVHYGKTQKQYSYAHTTIAVERRRNSQNIVTDFIPVTAWYSNADFLYNYIPKGTLVSIRGSINTSSYTNKNGTDVRVVEVLISDITILERKNIVDERRRNVQNQNIVNNMNIQNNQIQYNSTHNLNPNQVSKPDFVFSTNPKVSNKTKQNNYMFDLDEINKVQTNSNEFMFDLDNIDKLD
ncbi:single-stranded DNA-binding protein [Mycoplasmopsis pullorum]|uniref:single-stranded DNA-binding protein n=1 Tax=Mycoplasmopsis pullorum TaxID=48003 RepID=UPI001117ED2A|nr:single-stranded DNA-binding protein [Mycoplasmopsis pullorum]TNK83280.1 single-stranded DNA-binding protein [Mycoplasmopsis pullorum]TNK88080.1 single-stranded DNA-binding protein [Mycoplasmopsis pullorum]TNK91783.1 single-stranded DNA-binding protein [Mycoplasmopsis pullorum]